ncbi:hypothetical protein PMM47T1_24174 [Pseudomonas sp. M47T1]|uniref:hypothetical protein n=1 Tax=Pseudomonas sp. M47T1 TaxID=1179778 RepID=UPI0002607E0A|nr:hypothetical protein [Pseudomonas sp. M47T1]EIK94047.1 hypothetical protein PMM47T1_24174 [Pseudomonas sp. M47T1]
MLDNPAHRALFTLPPMRETTETLPATQPLPAQQVVTGDKEVDALLWLRKVVSTGLPGPIAVAMEAAKKLKAPAEDLERRYRDYLLKNSGGNPFATFGSFGFADLSSLAERAIAERARAVEAAARFEGDAIWEDTPAEQFCAKALKRCKGFKDYVDNDKAEVAKRFRKHGDLMPHTLSDCLAEIDYWDRLYRLREAVGERGDGMHEAIARERFTQDQLAVIKPNSRDEAIQVLDYVAQAEGIDHDGMVAIFLNLLDHPGTTTDAEPGESLGQA